MGNLVNHTTGHITLHGVDEILAANKGLSLKESRRAGSTIRRAWNRECKTGLRPAVQQHVKSRLSGNTLVKSYMAKAEYAANGMPEVVVYSRVAAVIPHEKGLLAPIVPKSGKYLAIPTDMAMKRLGGRKGSKVASRRRLKPRMVKNAFWGKSKKGNPILFQRIKQDTKVSKYLAKAKGKFYAGEVIPMFTLVKMTVLPKRTDVFGVALRYAPRMAGVAIDALVRQFYNHGNRVAV